jgi:tetratricopeptide (TPR) repeat protein
MTVESVDSLCQKARQAIAQGQAEQARQLYLQALGLRSDVPDVHYGLATACFLLNDLESAAYHFQEVTRLDPLRPGAYINLGAVHNRLGEYEEAVKVLRRGIQIDPHRAEGYYNLGLVYRSMGQPHLAVQAYLEATRLDPRMIDGHYNLGNLYLETGRYQLAAVHYKKVLQLRPNWERARSALAQAEAALGKTGDSSVATVEVRRPPVNVAAPSLERSVDPAAHGQMLTVLHHAAIDSESHGRQFLDCLEHQIEPVIKELSARLLAASAGSSGKAELGQCVRKFEDAIANMRNLHRELETCIDKVRTLGEQLLNS